MIEVLCDACGAGFKARDELAGRRGKCPSCGEPIVVPDAGPDAGPEDEDDELAAPAFAAPVASGGGARRGGSRRGGGRRPARSRGAPVGLYLALGGIAVAVAAFFLFRDAGGGPQGGLALGIDALRRNDYAAAIAHFESVPPDAPTYAAAQKRSREAKEQKQRGDQVRLEAQASAELNNLDKIRKSYVDRDGLGHTKPDYRGNTRYLLKRAAGFLAKYPGHPRTKEIAGWPTHYAAVADLSKPPTEFDVDAELNFRFMGAYRDYAACMSVINEFAAGFPEKEAEALSLRGRVQNKVNEDWSILKSSKLDGLMKAGQQNWQKVANEAKSFIDSVDKAPGLSVPEEARKILALAESKPIGS